MNRQRSAYLHAACAVLFWSTAATAFKLTLQYADTLQLLFISSLTSLTVFFAVLLIQGRFRLIAQMTKQDVLRSCFLGFLNPFLYYIVLFTAYTMLPAQQALTLNYTWPIMLVILSVFLLGQKMTARSMAALFISFSGAVIIAARGEITSLHFTQPYGVVLALGSSVIWALYWIYNVRDSRPVELKLFLNFAFGTLYIICAMLIFSHSMVFSLRAIAGSVYIGLFEMGVTFLLWLKAMELSDTSAHIGNLVYLSPFLSLMFIRLVIGEPIAFSTVIGLVCIVAGIVMQGRGEA